MGGQSVLADLGSVDETRLDHVPAEPSLQSAEQKKQG